MSVRASVILPTSGRAISLADTLATIVSQKLSCNEFEILVIENGPQSGAQEVTQHVARSNPGVRYVHEPTPGLLSGRHRGVQEARGEILVFADDDIDASAGWLAAISDIFSDPDVHLVGGPSFPHFELPPPAWIESYWYTPPYGGRACIYLSLLDLGNKPLVIDANYVWGLNFSIRRKTLLQLGGFHPDNLPDELQHFQGDGETGLTMKANEARLRTLYEPKAAVHHRVPAARLTVGYFLRRAFYQGVCDSFTAIRRDPGCLSVSESTEETLTDQRARHPNMASPRRDEGRFARVQRWLQSKATRTPEQPFEDIHSRVQASYRAGYRFHQDNVRRYPKLLEWVRRKDYWDYNLPDLGPNADIRRPELK